MEEVFGSVPPKYAWLYVGKQKGLIVYVHNANVNCPCCVARNVAADLYKHLV